MSNVFEVLYGEVPSAAVTKTDAYWNWLNTC